MPLLWWGYGNKKMTALMGDQAYPIDHFFDVVDLEVGEWTDIDGLQVSGIFSSPSRDDGFEFKAEEKAMKEYTLNCRY